MHQRGEFDETIRFFERATQLDPNSSAAWSRLGVLLNAKSDYISSETAHLRALSLLSDRQTLTSYRHSLIRSGPFYDRALCPCAERVRFA